MTSAALGRVITREDPIFSCVLLSERLHRHPCAGAPEWVEGHLGGRLPGDHSDPGDRTTSSSLPQEQLPGNVWQFQGGYQSEEFRLPLKRGLLIF